MSVIRTVKLIRALGFCRINLSSNVRMTCLSLWSKDLLVYSSVDLIPLT